jgi:hypothetical protein
MATMTDDGAPYSGAIEESARAAGKALDLIKDASGPIADVYGIITETAFTRLATGGWMKLPKKRRKS